MKDKRVTLTHVCGQCQTLIKLSLKNISEADARKRMEQRIQAHRDAAGHSRVEATA